MPQSLSAVYVHLVWSTRDRRPCLRDETVRHRIHEYIGGASNQLDCTPVVVGGTEDHVHMLAKIDRVITIADWVKELKRVSSIWTKGLGRDFRAFHWQGGYAGFSVSASNVTVVKRYIENQVRRHRTMTFQDELRTLLKKHRIEWDERYVWD